MTRENENAPIEGATNPRYIAFVSVSKKNKCQNWRFMDFISQMHSIYNNANPIIDHDEWDEFIEENKSKYEANIYET